MKKKLEFAGAASPAALAASRQDVLARAPLWWRNLANQGLRSAAAAKVNQPRPGRATATASAQPRWAGWIAGVACAGVSLPVFSPSDGRQLREQFTDAGLRSLLKGKRDIPLTWGHGGPTLCRTTGLDLLLSVRPLLGLCFMARVADTASNRQIMQTIGERDVIGVSIAFSHAKGWTVGRDDLGEIRVINAATIDHVALLPRTAQARPAYPTAWAAASIGHRDLCPCEVTTKARRAAYDELKRQAGIRC